jgi:hypothetical protein
MAKADARRQRGSIRRRGNSLQVAVYAGLDPLTGKRMFLSESTTDPGEAERIRWRLVAQVDDERGPKTSATFGAALESWLRTHEAEATTLDGYRGYVERTIEPALECRPETCWVDIRALTVPITARWSARSPGLEHHTTAARTSRWPAIETSGSVSRLRGLVRGRSRSLRTGVRERVDVTDALVHGVLVACVDPGLDSRNGRSRRRWTAPGAGSRSPR